MKDVFYFPHYYNSRISDELIQLAEDHKAAGYGLYWIIMEILHEAEDSHMDYDERQVARLARRYAMPEETIRKIIDDCIHVYELFLEEDGRICSITVLENKVRRRKKEVTNVKNGREGGKTKAKNKKKALEKTLESYDSGGSVALSTKERKESKESKENDLETIVSVGNEVPTEENSLPQAGGDTVPAQPVTSQPSTTPTELQQPQAPDQPQQPHAPKTPVKPQKQYIYRQLQPYMDDWNAWAVSHAMPRITKITDDRRRKLTARMKEPEFDMQHLLDIASRSTSILGGNWFTFDWLISSVQNYQKLSEGAYTDKQVPERNETHRRQQEANRHDALLAASRAFLNS